MPTLTPEDQARQQIDQMLAASGWQVQARPRMNRTAAPSVAVRASGAPREAWHSPIRAGDALASHPGEHFDLVLTNPPFGKKSSVTHVTEEGELLESCTETIMLIRVRSENTKEIAG